MGSSLGTSIIGIVLAIGFYSGIPIELRNTGLLTEIPPDQAQWVYGLTYAAVNQGMEYAFIAMLLVVIVMFIATLFMRKTGKIVRT